MRSDSEKSNVGYGPLLAALVGFLSVGSLLPSAVFLLKTREIPGDIMVASVAFAASLLLGALVDGIASRGKTTGGVTSYFRVRGAPVAGLVYLAVGTLGIAVTGFVAILNLRG